MKKIFFLVSLIFSLCVNCYGQDMAIYKSPYFNFTVEYPADWETRELSGIVGFISPQENVNDDFSENVNIVVEGLSQNPMTLEQYMDASLVNAEKMIPNFKLLNKGNATIDNNDARYIVYTGEGKFKIKAYTLIMNYKAYTLTYIAKESDFDTYLSKAEAIMKSFRCN